MKILNAGPGFSQPMTEDEIILFLTSGRRNIYIASLDEKNEPNIHPVWYYFDPSKEKFYIETSKYSKKKKNLEKNEIIYFCVDEPNIPYKGVRGKAKVDIIQDIDSIVPICERNMKKYLGNLEHPMAKELVNLAKRGESVAIEISPLYFSTWDDGKVKFQ
ncbi:MAG TPA: pyridoxamine 5'-phosphate oxidase family protein [Nitrososphaeraceae archaeon]|jgi:general stress protein 26|nr:pyridoxamine 5'-phosphate oxidase family protein [Nitrososphaeraceae archaeon]